MELGVAGGEGSGVRATPKCWGEAAGWGWCCNFIFSFPLAALPQRQPPTTLLCTCSWTLLVH